MEKRVYLPFMQGKAYPSLGLKPLAVEDWIQIDQDFATELTLKAKLLAVRYSEVLASLPGSRLGQQEALTLLVHHLLQQFPDIYEQQGDRIYNRIMDQAWNVLEQDNPLDLAGRLVQEDFCLLLPGEDHYRLVAASVCFPLRWRLQDKLGKPLAQIHQPVPGYEEALARPVNQVFQQLRVDYPGYRFNWSLVDSPELFLPGLSQSNRLPITVEEAGEQLWLRVERQTLRRLPISGGILFGIRTYIYSLATIANDPIVSQALALAIQRLSPKMQLYKSLLPYRSALLTYLEAMR